MKKSILVMLLLALCVGLLAGCGKPSDARTPMSQARFEQLLQARGYEPLRIPEDDLDDFGTSDEEGRTHIPTALSAAQGPGLRCVYLAFADADDAKAWAEDYCRETEKYLQVHREGGSNWERFTAQDGEGDSWKLLRVENVLLTLSTYSDEEAMQAGEELFRALEEG